MLESNTVTRAYYIKAPRVAKLDDDKKGRLDIRSSLEDGPAPVAGVPDRRGV